MTNGLVRPDQGSLPIVISVDAMGGDLGPAAVVAGLVISVAKLPDVQVILHGDAALLNDLVARQPTLAGRCTVRHAPHTVTMDDKPAQVMRRGEGTSMWSTIEAVRNNEATVAISCGNTGALMALSMIRLRKLPGVNRPAIASLLTSRNPAGFNVMLDMGADIKADAEDLLQYATMGAAYASIALDLAKPRVGLLNVGTEEHKGRAELKQAHDQMTVVADAGGFAFVGFVEGSDILGRAADVIVTDGFTGNIALKTVEGTARIVADFLRDALNDGWMAKLGALLALSSLKRLRQRIDPRRVNGGVFLGLNGTVVKSHGSADATGVSAAVGLAYQLAKSGFREKLAERLALAALAGHEPDATGKGAMGGIQ